MTNVEKETTAKTLSKNKIKKFSEQTLLVENSSKNSNFLDGFELASNTLKRGWYDIASINLRYVNSKIYNIYCPNDENKKDLFKIFSVARCFKIGFEDFSGCRKNILKILPEFKKSFFSKQNKENKFLFNFLLKFLSNKTCSFLKFKKNFPMASEDKMKKILNNINDEEKYYHLVSKLVSSLNPNIDEEENISSQESYDSKNAASAKKKRIN